MSIVEVESLFESEPTLEDQIAAEVLVRMSVRPAVQEKKKKNTHAKQPYIHPRQPYIQTKMMMKPAILQKLIQEPFIHIPFWNPNPSEYFLVSDREPINSALIPSMNLLRKYTIAGHTHGYPIGKYIEAGSHRFYRLSVFVGICPLLDMYMIGVICGNMKFFKNDQVHARTYLKNKEIIFLCNFGTNEELGPRFDAYTCALTFRGILLDGFKSAGLNVVIQNRAMYVKKEEVDSYKRMAHKLILKGMKRLSKKTIIEIPHVNVRSD